MHCYIYIVIVHIWLCFLPQYSANPIGDRHNYLLKRTRRSSILDPNGLFQGDIILFERQKKLLEKAGYGRHINKRDTEPALTNLQEITLNETDNFMNNDDITNNTVMQLDFPALRRKPRNAGRELALKWPDGIVKYYFKPQDFTTDQKSKIREAMDELERVSCVKFKEQSYGSKQFVNIRFIDKSEKCAASPGYSTDESMYFKGSTRCLENVNNIVHEMLHVLGFWHMQSHPNRDYYVRIKWNNIKDKQRKDFAILPGQFLTTFGVPYDCSSIMHYGPHSGAKVAGLVTMEPQLAHRRTCILNDNNRLTAQDICKLNRMYKCSYKCNVLKYRRP